MPRERRERPHAACFAFSSELRSLACPQGITVGGWRIESSEDHILGSRELLLLSTRLGNPYQSQFEVPFCVPGSLGSLKPCSCGSALVMGVRMVRCHTRLVACALLTEPLRVLLSRSICPRACLVTTGCSWSTSRLALGCDLTWAVRSCSGC